MSARSEKAKMREALEITESNLSSLIAAKYSNYTMMIGWRNMCRRALGTMPYQVSPDPDPNFLLAREIWDFNS